MRWLGATAVLIALTAAAWGAGLDEVLPPLDGQGGPFGAAARQFSVRAVPSQRQVTAGQSFWVALEARVAEGWVWYSPSPGESPLYTPTAASITVEAGGWKAGEVLWPKDQPHQTDLAGKSVTNFVYGGRALVYVPITVAPDAGAGEHALTFIVAGQVCSDKQFQCLPVQLKVATSVTVGQAASAGDDWTADIAAGLQAAVLARQLRAAAATLPADGAETSAAGNLTVGAGLALALLAGLILNIMPCVLPVIPLRVLSLVELARQSQRRFVTVGLAFAAGILLFFVALAAINAALHLAGGSLNWGQQFQSGPFRVVMAVLMTALAANLFGVFTVLVPSRVAAIEGGGKAQGHLSSLGMGLMMAILATPCSFAILVAALAWARIQPLWLGSLAIMLIGVGMAAPHALLTAFPSLLAHLPRPGRWMELLKQSMGFVLLLVAVWLLSTLNADAYPMKVAGFCVIVVFCLWVWGTAVGYDTPPRRKVLYRSLAIAVAVAAGWLMLSAPKPSAVQFAAFDESAIAQAARDGQVVLVDFTAAWCLSCKIVDAVIYDNPEVAAALKERGVLAMRGDVTAADSPANHLLYDKLGGAPPLTVIFPPAGQPIRLEGKFSKADLMAALDRANAK
ncbi:MAG: cytochrome c biogenesis protein CcdA [Phycisphaerae bacterium]